MPGLLSAQTEHDVCYGSVTVRRYQTIAQTDRLANERTLLMLNASKMVTGTDLDVSQPMVMGGAQGRRRRSHLPLDQADVAETRAVAQCDRHHPPGC